MNPGLPASVLVVDDDEALSRLLRILLESDSFTVKTAPNGKDALEVVREFIPDVILLDLQMPVMDGRTFYREFRQRGFTTPVIILSAYNPEEARAELGAELALRKPFEPLSVSSAVRAILNSAQPEAFNS